MASEDDYDPLQARANGLINSHTLCVELGIGRARLQELADREKIPYVIGQWGVDEAKKMTARLLVIGSPGEKERARSVMRRLIDANAARYPKPHD